MTIQTVHFHNQEIQVLNYEGKPYVAMKPICENIGLAWNGQFERIRRNEVLAQGIRMIRMVAEDGKLREVFTIPLGMLNGWLFGIDTKRVKPEIRETLRLYQTECFDVLYNHFLPSVAKEHPNTLTIEQQQEIKSLVNEVSRKTGKHYQFIYSRMYERFKVPRYQEIKISDYPHVIKFLAEMAGHDLFEVDERKEGQIFAIALMKMGLQRFLEVEVEYRKIKEEVYEISDKLKKIGRQMKIIGDSDGAIYDGLAEAQIYLGLDDEIYQKGKMKADSLRRPALVNNVQESPCR